MNKKLLFGFPIMAIFLGLFFYFTYNSTKNIEIEDLRVQHQQFLENSPFKETLKLSKEERKALGLPPNAYNEQVWELTMDPQTGRPMKERVFETLEQLKNQRGAYRGVGGDANNPWVERGPNNIGGRTRALMFDPNDVGAGNGDGIDYNRVFAGGVSGGLWVNNDITSATSSWAQVPGFATDISVTVIISDPNNPSTFYLGSGESYTSGDAIGNGIWKSIDGGANWTNIFGGYTNTSSTGGGGYDQNVNGIFYINDLVARDVGSTTELYASVAGAYFADGANSSQGQWHSLNQQGLYKSIDNGAIWTKFIINEANGSSSNPNDIEFDINNNIWFTTTRSSYGYNGGKIFRSTDGISFTLMGQIPNAQRTEIEPDPSNADVLWALANVGGPADMFSIAYNSGSDDVTITQITTEPVAADTGIPNTDFTRGQAFYDLTIESDASGNLIVGGIDLFRSTDGAATWNQISKWSNNPNMGTQPWSIVHADHHATVQRPGFPNEYIFGTDGGVFYCTDITMAATSAVIPSRNKDYNTTQFYYADFSTVLNTGADDIIGGTQDNGTPGVSDATAGVNGFVDVATGDGGYTEIDDVGSYIITTYPGNTHYVLTPPNIMAFPPTSGTHYQISSGSGGSFINEAGLDKNLDILYSNASTGTPTIERTSSFISGAVNTPLTDALLDAAPTAFKVSPFTTTSSKLFVGLLNGKLIRLDTADTTPVWNDITGASFVGSISDIEFGQSEQEIFVTMHNYGVTSIWFTNDGGTTWTSKEGNLPDIPVKCILQNPFVPEELIIGTEIGVWATLDFTVASPVWVQSYNGMSDVTVLDLDLRSSDNAILAATHGRGLFTSSFPTPTTLTALFLADNFNPGTNDIVNLTDQSINGATTWAWSFSPNTVTYQGGTNANSQNPQVKFDVPGVYSATLGVTDGGTETDDLTKTNYISVIGLTANFTADKTYVSIADGDIVSFTDTSLNSPTSWTWAFTPNTVTYEGGTNANSQNPQVSFTAPSDYTVSLTIADGIGNDLEEKIDLISVISHCMPSSTNGCTIDGVKHFVLGTIDNTTSCGTDNGTVGYGNFTSLSTDLDIDFDDGNGQGVYQVSIQSNYAPEVASIWIDFNDNNAFEASEQLLSNGSLPTAGVDATFLITIPPTAPLGMHTLRVKAIDPTGTGTNIDNPCGIVQWGESEDYTVNIISSSLSTEDFTKTTGIIVYPTISKGNITIQSNLNLGDVKLDVYNISGQKVYSSGLELSNNTQKVNLNLASGIYFAQFTVDQITGTKKIIIK